jgi:hypothetical protein
MNFEEFCEDAADMTTIDIVVSYNMDHDEPFFCIEETYPVISDDELRRWALWCMCYGKSKDEYPLAKQFAER